MGHLLAGLAHWAVEIVYAFGYPGVFVLIALVNLHLLPIPTQLILGLAGFLVGQGRFSFVPLLAISTVASATSSLGLYFLGFWIGEEKLHQLIKRFERFKIVFASDLARASEVFEHHGGKAIFIGHLFPAVGALISVPAGFTRMPILGRFLIYTVLGCASWNGAFIGLGWALGARWESARHYSSIFEYAALIILVGGVLWLLRRRWKASRQLEEHDPS